MRVLERFHDLRVERRASNTQIGGRPEQVEHARTAGRARALVIRMHHVGLLEPPFVARLSDEGHGRLFSARRLGCGLG